MTEPGDPIDPIDDLLGGDGDDGAVEVPPLEPGDIVANRFRVEARLGEGGMGVVYRATHVALDRPVALKLLHPELSMNRSFRARFSREAKVCARLKHPNTVEVYDFGEHRGQLFLAMEMLSGKSLRELVDLDKPILPVSKQLRIEVQLAEALSAAHAIPLVHRDLKPENVMLEAGPLGEERVVVVDFGLAFLPDEGEDLGRLTSAGLISGTPQYLSPEQARAVDVGPPADIYQLGCMFYELATGVPPFEADSPVDYLNAHLFLAPIPPRDRHRGVQIPEALETLILEMLAKDPAVRPTAVQVRERLAKIDPAQKNTVGAREAKQAAGREGRMVQPPDPQAAETRPAFAFRAQGDKPALAVMGGALSDDARIRLSANGLDVRDVPAGGSPAGADAIYAPGAGPREIGLYARAAPGTPIVATVNATEMDQMMELLRAGAAEVVALPVATEELVTKVLRALRHAQRQQRKPKDTKGTP